MFGKRCPSCNERVKKKFNYCPHCSYGLKQRKPTGDFGLLGLGDDIKLPFGFNAIMKPLMKQLEKELGSLDMSELNQNMGQQPKGFKIQISTGKPQNHQNVGKVEMPVIENDEVSHRESERRQKLPRVDAKSTIRRLPEGIVYEISTPGVKNQKEVVVSQLEDGIEVRAYSKAKCYTKIIPMKAEILGYKVSDEKVLVKLKA